MNTPPFPNVPRSQYVTLSPEWYALLKIGGAYRLLYRFILIGFILMVVFCATMFCCVLDQCKEFPEMFQGGIQMGTAQTESFSEPEAETLVESFPADLENPTEEDEASAQFEFKMDFERQKFEKELEKRLGESGIIVFVLFVFVLFSLAFLVLQIIVLIRFANCPNSIVPGGHGVGLAYAICTGISLILGFCVGGGVNPVQALLIAPLNLAAFILFLVFSGKVATAVQSRRANNWLKRFITAFCGIFVLCFLIGLTACSKQPEAFATMNGVLALLLMLDCFLVWFSLLMLIRSLGRDVPFFIERVQNEYISSLT